MSDLFPQSRVESFLLTYLLLSQQCFVSFIHLDIEGDGNREKVSLDKQGRSDRDVVYSLKCIGIYLRWSDLLSLKN